MENNKKYSPELRAEAVLELLDGKRKVKEIVKQLEKTKRKLNFLKRRDF
ncbi:transposase [Senegalia sp. (in: firmicutes)]